MTTNTQTADTGAFILRVALGIMFVAHAYLKIAVFTPAGTAQFFESLGLPGILAYATIAAELFGGLALIAGFQTRVVSAALVPVLLGATWAHLGNGWVFSVEGGGWEYPAFLVAAAVAQVFLGAGVFAVNSRIDDAVVARITGEQHA